MSKKHVILVIVLFFIGIVSAAYGLGNDASGDELIDCDTTTEQQSSKNDTEDKKYDESINESIKSSDNNVKCETGTKLYVHVCGEVKKPGVYEIGSEEARVINAIKAAGGLTDKASSKSVNQAELIKDGQQIYIPSKEEASKDSTSSSISTDSTSTSSISTSKKEGTVASKVNINTATEEELVTLPGIGTAKAGKIIEFRETRGRFKKIEDIMNIPGIKEGLFNKISENITV